MMAEHSEALKQSFTTNASMRGTGCALVSGFAAPDGPRGRSAGRLSAGGGAAFFI
jgi:hypothetical protein